MNVFINKKKCYSQRGLVKQPLFGALARKQWESTDGSESMREKLWKKQDFSEGKNMLQEIVSHMMEKVLKIPV